MSFGGPVPGPALPAWMRSGGLHTVCEEARCPNRSECFGRGTATFLINGRVCTRNCTYCSIAHGRPAPLDPAEPEELARTAEEMGLRHVVITSVDRDDLPDGGSGAFVECIRLLGELAQRPTIEVLTPDFRGDMASVDVYNHTVEAVPRLYRQVRRSGRYEWALEVLGRVAAGGRGLLPKSGLMVGLGEERGEILAVLEDLARAGCRMVTIGQYLRPTVNQTPVARYWAPEEMAALEEDGRRLGLEVIAGPFVRSSYRAEEAFLSCSQSAARAAD